jgi:serine phosphatase RsbU (regulator of sigma subunit)
MGQNSLVGTSTKFKSFFINNFTRTVSWPVGAIQDTFRMGIIKDKEIAKEMSKIATKEKFQPGNVPKKVYYLEDLSHIRKMDMVYTNYESNYSAKELLEAIGKNPILLVTENYDYSTTMINFIIDNNKQKYEVNVANIETRNLIVDNVLLKTGAEVEDEQEWQKKVREMRQNLNTTQQQNKEQTKKILNLSKEVENLYEQVNKLNQSIDEKTQVLEEKEENLKRIEEAIKREEAQAKRLEEQLDSNQREIEAKERLLFLSNKEFTRQMIEIEKAKKDFEELEANRKRTLKSLENQKLFTAAAAIVSVLIALLLIIVYRSAMKQRKQAVIIQHQKDEAEIQRDEIQAQHLELADKNREITDSITYAKRIQDAMLPPLPTFRRYLPDSFIFYVPKDIVAGDFYWMEALEDRVIFAAADCTGHGVPGAIVSVICSNALNRSVREFHLSKPSDILDKTLEIVLEKFKSSGDEVKDGMDIAMCCYDPKTGKLQYAGANNPLWIIRKNGSEVEEYKADKQPIGKYLRHTPFTNHETVLAKGDTIYIFSDGYADQFGGEQGKKFRSLHFKELLISLKDEPINVQKKQVEKAFYGWKGNLEQLDDICVIGFRA